MTAPLALLALSLPSAKLKSMISLPREIKATAWLLFFAPYIYAFGTANIYWIPIASAGIFVVLLGLLAISVSPSKKQMEKLLAFGLLVQLFALFLLWGGLENPYRQPHSLHLNDTKTLIGKHKSALILADSSARYLNAAKTITDRENFTLGTPILDLTGKSPGLVFALGGNSIGLPWVLGGYPGSQKYFSEGLRNVPCDTLVAAWLITESNNASGISPEILTSFGANFESDYKLVGSFLTTENTLQQIFRPVRTIEEALYKCSLRVSGRKHRTLL